MSVPSTFGQLSITTIERDSVVSKVHQLIYCIDKLKLADQVIFEADKTINMSKQFISKQSILIDKLSNQNKALINSENDLYKDLKLQKQKTTRNFFYGIGIGAVSVVLLLIL